MLHRHPFREFDWKPLQAEEVPLCTAALFLSAVLCSAAGIGGGGIYVAVLMVLGGVSTQDAVPLSKAVVFSGAVASMVLNLRRQLWGAPAGGDDQRGIDFDVLRLVVPMALSGTFFGVCLNFHVPDKVIVIILTAMLCYMTLVVVRTAWSQHAEEECQADTAGLSDLGAEIVEETRPLISPRASAKAELGKRDSLSGCDIGMFAILVFIVVIGGTVRFHAHACKDDESSPPSCRHPLLEKMFLGYFEHWMKHHTMVLHISAWAVPLCLCVAMSMYYGHEAKATGWQTKNILTYQFMACITGLLAGLVGIGGGLVFSPLFLLMGLQPHVAVATSSTCVLFTSGSTSIQYLFTDRIVISLALLYGFVTLCASWAGTSLVHTLQDRYKAKQSYITWIVAVGVAISAALSFTKFMHVLREENIKG